MSRMSPEGLLLQDLTTRFQVYLEQVKTGQIADIDEVIREFSDIVTEALPANASLTQRWKVQDTVRAMGTKMRAAAKRYKKQFMASLDEVATAAATNGAIAVGKVAGKKVKVPNSKALKEAIRTTPLQATGTQLEAFIDSWGESAIRRVTKEVTIGAAQGLTNQELVQKIRGTRANQFRDGILGNATKREADAMVRTATQHAASEAVMEMYRENDDIIEGYIWVSTLDARTSSQCRALDLEFFELGKGPVPPLHVNCRSTTIPKIEGVDLLGNTTRASMDGQVPANMSYYEWLKNQDPQFQDEVLGKHRGELFRRDDMTPSKFAEAQLDKSFEPISVEELSEKVGVVNEDRIPLDTLDPATQEYILSEKDRYERFNDLRLNVTYEDFLEKEAAYSWDFEGTEEGYVQWLSFMDEQIASMKKELDRYDLTSLIEQPNPTLLEKHVAGVVREGFDTVPSTPLPKYKHFNNMEEVSEFWLEYQNASAINHVLAGGKNPQQFFQSPLTEQYIDKLNEAAYLLRESATSLPDKRLLRGAVFHTEKELAALFPEGQVVTSKRFLSATTSMQVAEQYMDGQFIGAFGDDPVVKVLFSITGRGTSRLRGYRLQLPKNYGDWDEVLLMPGTEYHVARYTRHRDYIEVVLEVVNP